MSTLFLLGGSGDIGRAVAGHFEARAWTVTAPRHKDLDLEDRNSIDRWFRKHPPQADALVHCAGWNRPKPAGEVTPADLDGALAVHATGFHWVVRHFLPLFRKRKSGRVVAVSSIYGLYSRPNRLAYASAKHALNGLVRSLALELGPLGVNVNLVSPGFVDTDMTRRNNPPRTLRDLKARVPLGRLAAPEEIAGAVHFLCSPESSFVHGANLVVDGGYSIGGFQP